ncbi:DUF1059 domain-containing protein [Candidatus Azambacteria bacterium]|nr:DUF1059 domain-containing protein [Candidatus Azambacteria bacterium]MBI2587717.1 DUF1059 domain-containing protein [Candidatus Azambacteria bacterium]
MKELKCRDLGMDCDQVMHGETEDAVMEEAKKHGMEAHGMTEADMTPEMMEKMHSHIHDAM